MRNKETHKLPCNCRIKMECPMDGNCELDNVDYQAFIFPKEAHLNENVYSVKWKFRHYKDTQSFNDPVLRNQTA